jgi:hypothetical protein
MVDSLFNEITSHFPLWNNNLAKNVLNDLGPEIYIGSSSLAINILNKAFNILDNPCYFS